MGNSSILKHGDTKPIQIDFTSFKKKSINQRVSESQLTDQLKIIQQKQDELNSYKYSQDFDRVSMEQNPQIATYQQALQNTIKYSAVMALFLTKFYISHVYQSQQVLSLFKRYYFPIFLGTFMVTHVCFRTSAVNHVIHQSYYREDSPQMKRYRVLDEEMDLYKYVDDIKYRFDYSSSDILKTRKTYYQGYLRNAEEGVFKFMQNKNMNRQKYQEVDNNSQDLTN